MNRYIIFFICFCLLFSCSRKRVNFKNKSYHKLTAYYNILFNGQEALNEIVDGYKKSYVDNYDEVLKPVPIQKFTLKEDVEIEVENTQKNNDKNQIKTVVITGISGRASADDDTRKKTEKATGLDRAIEKAKKAIENHSMFSAKTAKEENRLMASAYFLLGQARYYKGNSFPALDAFDYVETYLPEKSKNYYNAILYQALTNEQIGNDIEAETIYEKLIHKKKLPKSLKKDIHAHYAEFLINQKKYQKAIIVLNGAIKSAGNKKDKARYLYIQGQLLQLLGKNADAREKFKLVFKRKPGYEMEVKSQVAIAQNYNPKVHKYIEYKNNLLRHVNKGTYKKYKNELYYAAGELAIKSNKPDEAKKYLKLALEENESSANIRGLTYGLLGDVYFNNHDYIAASAYYDSAVSKTSEPEAKAKYTSLKENLEEVKKKHYLIEKNDSILAITKMSYNQQKEYFENYIKKLKKTEEAESRLHPGKDELIKKLKSFTNEYTAEIINQEKGGKFYFYSQGAKTIGNQEFYATWGDRKLQDNWRLVTGQASLSIEEEKDSLLGKEDTKNPRRFDPDFYLEKIPSTQTEIVDLKLERDSAQLFLGKLYYDRFSNEVLATETLQKLIASPPAQMPVEREAYFTLYKISSEKKLPETNKYKEEILRKYPESKYADFITNPEVLLQGSSSKEAVQLYLETYQAYKQGNHEKVKANTQIAQDKYAQEDIMQKFSLINAYSIGATHGKEKFIQNLENIIILYPGSEVAEKAKELMLMASPPVGEQPDILTQEIIEQ